MNVRTYISVAVVLCVVSVGSAATYVVDPNGSRDFTTIQAAIDAPGTVGGSRIIVTAGTYREHINLKGKAITLSSSDPNDAAVVSATIIDGVGTGRCITFNSGEDANTVVNGFVITGGHAAGSYPNGFGGGIFCFGSSPTILNCSISANSSDSFGGGMGCDTGSSPTLRNCSFTGNSAAEGAAVVAKDSNLTFENCNFTYNSASQDGGGISSIYGNNVTVTDCSFTGNSAKAGGGIFSALINNLTVTNCRFSANRASLEGGGLRCSANTVTITNSIFTSNSTNYDGGGISCGSSTTIQDSLICGNFHAYSLASSQISGSYTDKGGNTISDYCPPPRAVTVYHGDLDGDGDVDFDDVAKLANNWLSGTH
ncbi:MAG TPA: right-handed parallel beta-helix repeat-containing protein [Sedimentisphaerales bacterium]|nr:right-handed parallel beta-helix repeat-containing protein [Sedimentisphaerales bacterium]